ncbi:hypothetical protein [Streptomyces kurssanovii]|uniref:HEAT repeat domain-containing protein n=1 Tax=Streptomyces kurssanovii TaxID=67312 RepID=A0ABV3HX32_9ACTN
MATSRDPRAPAGRAEALCATLDHKDLVGRDAATQSPRPDAAADELGDVLEAGSLEQADAERVVTVLVRAVTSQCDRVVQEACLNALSHAVVRYRIPYALLEPIAGATAELRPRELAYVPFILSATHDPGARAVAERLLLHPDAEVRAEAAQAIDELDAVAAAGADGAANCAARAGNSR